MIAFRRQGFHTPQQRAFQDWMVCLGSLYFSLSVQAWIHLIRQYGLPGRSTRAHGPHHDSAIPSRLRKGFSYWRHLAAASAGALVPSPFLTTLLTLFGVLQTLCGLLQILFGVLQMLYLSEHVPLTSQRQDHVRILRFPVLCCRLTAL